MFTVRTLIYLAGISLPKYTFGTLMSTNPGLILLYICNINGQYNWWWVSRDTLKSQTPDSLVVPSISYLVIKGYKYADVVSIKATGRLTWLIEAMEYHHYHNNQSPHQGTWGDPFNIIPFFGNRVTHHCKQLDINTPVVL